MLWLWTRCCVQYKAVQEIARKYRAMVEQAKVQEADKTVSDATAARLQSELSAHQTRAEQLARDLATAHQEHATATQELTVRAVTARGGGEADSNRGGGSAVLTTRVKLGRTRTRTKTSTGGAEKAERRGQRRADASATCRRARQGGMIGQGSAQPVDVNLG